MTLATRTLPVAIDVPIQLPLALVWAHPIERAARVIPDRTPEPSAVPVARARRAA